MSKLALYEDATGRWGQLHGDALSVLSKLPERSVDAVVTDPPYGIDFRGEAWDGTEIRRVAATKGGSRAEAFQAWTRQWAAQAARVLKPGGHLIAFGAPRTFHRLVCGVEQAGLEVRDTLLWLYGTGVPKSSRMQGGFGTALKPAYEPILLARAPMEGRAAQNLAVWGTGVLSIEAARVGENRYWPANVAFSHSPDCPAGMIDGESRGPSRLFFCAKASTAEREAGCGQLVGRQLQIYTGRSHRPRLARNIHPTVKPTELMRWLIRLSVPDGGIVLDPFAGSGSTGIAAVLEGRAFLGIERERDYVEITCARLAHHAREGKG